jgi:hypothetical protein
LLAEAAVLVGAACLLLHLVTALGHHGQDVVLTVVMLGMAVACAPCLSALWAWTITGAMYAVMLGVHLAWLGFGPDGAVHFHGSGELTWGQLGMWGGLGLAGIQLVLAAVGLMQCGEEEPAVGGSAVTPVR